jgi:hypothetical protein
MCIQTIGYYLVLKRNELIGHEKMQRKLRKQEASLKRLHSVWLQLHDILEKAKQWDKGKCCRRERDGTQGTFRQWNHSVWYYNGGNMTLSTWQNSQNVDHQEWTQIVNHGFWVLKMYQQRFLDCNNWSITTLLWDVVDVESHTCKTVHVWPWGYLRYLYT